MGSHFSRFTRHDSPTLASFGDAAILICSKGSIHASTD
jgi:hypothetical protein